MGLVETLMRRMLRTFKMRRLSPIPSACRAVAQPPVMLM